MRLQHARALAVRQEQPQPAEQQPKMPRTGAWLFSASLTA